MRSSRWSSPARWAHRGTLALGLALFGLYATTLGVDQRPGRELTGAGAHVLLVTQSLADDRDLDLRNQYAERAWAGWYHGTLRPNARADAAGRIFEPQGVGLPLLLVPAWAIGGVTAVRLFLAALAAFAFAAAAALARRLVPDPWATGAALAVAISPPVVAASTTIRPETASAAALAGAAVLAIRIRDEPRAAPAFWAALLIAAVPWLGLPSALAAVAVALAMARWLRQRRRGMAGFVAIEVVLTSAVIFITINDRLFGGLSPYASRLRPGPVTGLHDVAGALERVDRVGILLWDLLRWAPVCGLAVAGGWLLVQAHRTRLAAVVPEQAHVQVIGGFCALAVGAQVLEAAVFSPRLHGQWFPTRWWVPVLPFVAALAAPAARRFPRIALGVGGATAALTLWMLVAGLAGDATLSPPRGFAWGL